MERHAGFGREEATEAGIIRGSPRRAGAARSRLRGRKSAVTAALLSFIWPGLGQSYAGRTGRALFFGAPPLVVLLVLLLVVAQGADRFVVSLLLPQAASTVVSVIVLAAVWRVVAITDAWRLASAGRRGLASAGLVVVLSLAVAASHALAGHYVQSVQTAGSTIFVGGSTPGEGPSPLDDLLQDRPLSPSPLSTPPIREPAPATAPPSEPGAEDGATTVLFVGVDSGPGRDHALTDTLIVASFDPTRRLVSMVSLPRDTGRLPMFDGGTYDDRINSLLGHARRNPEQFPQGPIAALVQQMEHLIGIRIDYYAVTDMAGLERAIELVGGISIFIDHEVADPRWNLHLSPGRHQVDAPTAMRIVRSRYGPGNSDYMRARRQQALLKGLADRARDPAVIARLPELARAMGAIARSNVPIDRLPDLLALFDLLENAERRSVVLSPPHYARRIPPAEVGGRYMIELDMGALAGLSVDLYGQRSRYWEAPGD